LAGRVAGRTGEELGKYKIQKRFGPGGESEGSGEAGRPVSAWVAQLVERVLGKDEVTGSIPVPGSSFLILRVLGWIGGAGRSD
jgi:hypothetical protein